jgi:hypothetical protein
MVIINLSHPWVFSLISQGLADLEIELIFLCPWK